MPTALVTGASSGIGLTFARHLAQKQLSLVLVARSTDRLEQVAAECRAMGAPHVEVLTADLGSTVGLAAVTDRLAAGDVHTLVNNAGLSVGQEFADAEIEDLAHQLQVNVEAVLRLTHAALPGMLARGAGAIVNVASIAALLPGRGTTYSAAKAWVVNFTEGLATDLAGTGIRVQVLCPGFVRTSFHRAAGIDMDRTPGWMYVDVDHLVATSLRDLARGKVLSVPGTLYTTIATVSRLLPRPLLRRLAAGVKSKGRD